MRRDRNDVNIDPVAGLPPPPPYQPVADPRARQPQRQQFAPPPGPPPGHQQEHSGTNPFTNPRTSIIPQSGTAPLPRPPQNVPSSDASSYVSSSTSPSRGSPAFPSGGRRPDSVSGYARRMSQEMMSSPHTSSSAGTFEGRRQPSIKENQLEFLRNYDTIFIVDDSSSMNVNERPDGSIGQSRWEEARDALAGMVELACSHDDDGIDVHFLNSEKSLENCKTPQMVKSLFDSIVPEGLTPMGTKIELLLLEYMDEIEKYKRTKAGVEPKKRNYVCITDGAATDDPESVIVACARRLDQGNFPLAQIGIQFVQIGDDIEAKESLEELDDALGTQHKIRDIVDTVPYSGMALNSEHLVKALLGGINRRLDRKKVS